MTRVGVIEIMILICISAFSFGDYFCFECTTNNSIILSLYDFEIGISFILEMSNSKLISLLSFFKEDTCSKLII